MNDTGRCPARFVRVRVEDPAHDHAWAGRLRARQCARLRRHVAASRAAIVALDGVASVMTSESPGRTTSGGDDADADGIEQRVKDAEPDQPGGTLSRWKMPLESVRAVRLVPSITTSAFVSAVSCRLSITTTPVIRDGRFARAAALSCARATLATAMTATTTAATPGNPGATRHAQRGVLHGNLRDVQRATRDRPRLRALLTTGRVLPAGEDLEAPTGRPRQAAGTDTHNRLPRRCSRGH